MNRVVRYLSMMFALTCLCLTFGVSCSRSTGVGNEGKGEEHAEGEGEAAHDEHGEEGGEEKHEEGVVELTPEAHARAGIETAAVEAQALGAVLDTTGQVGFNEDRLAHVGPRISGRITAVSATLGQRVKRGETLAVLDSTELGQAKAAYQQALARETLTRETYERERRLAAEKISSEQEALTARAAHLEAAAELRRAEETLRLMGLAASQMGQAGSSLSPVTSPFAGTVVEKEADLGEMVSPERNLFTVADLSRVWIWIDVFEKDLRRVHPDDDVSVEVDAYPGETFEGKVSFLAGSVDTTTRTVRARIDVNNADGRLRPGMFARIRLTDPHIAPAGPGVPVVPESALQRRGEEFDVFVPDGERRYRRREVRTGRKAGDFVEILEGLKPGERVVVKGAFLLASEAAKETMGEGHSD
ncbi:MAG TPA: efflux RND transporter periplasmic adaptor subunit [Acidobacteria bacterium]|nr:efflux RND transporter periplasmic adaptor subunit [Acidobacteriota bacterium]